MSNFPICRNASFTYMMDELHSDHLSKGDILASPNCAYFLRAESNVLSLYSVSQHVQSKVYYWYHRTVWDIQSHSSPQTLSLSDAGCLTWSANNTTVTQFCDPYIPSTVYYTTSVPINNNSPTNQMRNEIWIPISLCIVVVLLASIFSIAICRKRFCKRPRNRNRNKKYIKPSQKKDDILTDDQLEYGLNIPVGYDDNATDSSTDIDTDSDYEIHENDMAHSNQSKVVHENAINIDMYDLTDSSDEAPEPEIVNLKKGLEQQSVPTKVKKGESKLMFGKFRIKIKK